VRYIINGEIHFRNTDGAIWKGDETEPESITLTVTTSRLLSFLLDHHGEVSTRDDILNAVWTDHGLRSSNNSLNKYIADLRKIFSSLELDDEVIITVPKVGFMFAKEISVKKEQNSVDYNHPSLISTKSNFGINHHKKSKPQRKFILIAFAIAFLGLSPIMLSKIILNLKLLDVHTPQQSNSYLLGYVNKCEIYILQQSSIDMTSVQLSIAEKLIKKTDLKCLEHTRLFYQPSDAIVYGYPGRVFLSRCTYNKEKPSEFAACDNYYGVNYTNEE